MKRFSVLICLILALSLTACGYSEEDVSAAYQAGYNEGYEAGSEEGFEEGRKTGYFDGLEEGKKQEFNTLRSKGVIPARPKTGDILSGKSSGKSELEITASQGEDYVVVLKDTKGKEQFAFYVRSGETATVKVPAKYLDVYFACGKDWLGYGKGLMFGDETSYSKDDETLNFKDYTWSYTLYPVTNGNFSETPSNAEEFF